MIYTGIIPFGKRGGNCMDDVYAVRGIFHMGVFSMGEGEGTSMMWLQSWRGAGGGCAPSSGYRTSNFFSI